MTFPKTQSDICKSGIYVGVKIELKISEVVNSELYEKLFNNFELCL